MAEESIFRQKSIDRLNTPEELRDYVRVTGIGLWIFLIAVILLLAGVCVWGCFGHLDTIVSTGAQVSDGKLYCYLSESSKEKVTGGTVVRIGGEEYSVDTQNIVPVEIDSKCDSYLRYLCGVDVGGWAYVLEGSCSLEDGVYEADAILDSISPVSLIIN